MPISVSKSSLIGIRATREERWLFSRWGILTIQLPLMRRDFYTTLKIFRSRMDWSRSARRRLLLRQVLMVKMMACSAEVPEQS